MVIPLPLRFALDVLPHGFEEQRPEECPSRGGDDQIPV
jgi:hypothetical protein